MAAEVYADLRRYLVEVKKAGSPVRSMKNIPVSLVSDNYG
jgi:hypothetical protein